MTAQPIVLVLPGGDPDRLPATIASVEAALGRPVPVIGLERADATELAATADFVGFVRPGDRLLPGVLESRLRDLAVHPFPVISIAGHRLIRGPGEPRLVQAPPPGSTPADLVIRATAEPATVLASASLVDRLALERLARPSGAAAVWSAMSVNGRYLAGAEVAAEVPLDPERHGYGNEARTGPLLEAVTGATVDDAPGDWTMRRELLRRLYLLLERDDEVPPLSEVFAGKLAGPAGAAAVVDDLEWLAERQAEALELERLRWIHGELRPEDAVPVTYAEELADSRAAMFRLDQAAKTLTAMIGRLESEIYRRDAIIAAITDLPIVDARTALAAEGAKGET